MSYISRNTKGKPCQLQLSEACNQSRWQTRVTANW